MNQLTILLELAYPIVHHTITDSTLSDFYNLFNISQHSRQS